MGLQKRRLGKLRGRALLELLDFIYGPAGQTDPYYHLLRDFVVLMPWWYPYFWAVLLGGFFGFKAFRALSARLRARKAARRVVGRIESYETAAPLPRVNALFLKVGANDDFPASLQKLNPGSAQ